MVNRIYVQADAISRKYRTRDPFELMESCIPNGKLRISDRFPQDGLKGFASIQNQFKYVVINGNLSEEEQRVVAGHEIGHILLHDSILRAEPMQDFDLYNATGKLEREANVFAADLLIADTDALDVIHCCDADFFSAAKALCVPAAFFAFKLYSLIQRGNKFRLPIDLDSRFLANGGESI